MGCDGMLKKGLIALLSIVGVALIGFFVYLNLDQYQAQLTTSYSFSRDGGTLYKLDNSNIGLIFYQGGKVDNLAYTYLTQVEANVFILDAPFNLSIFTINQADQIIKQYPSITTWYVGGHSLGGSTAYLYASETNNKIAGIIYLGAYPTATNNFRQLAIFGENDGLFDYQDYLSYFDADDTVKIITGGNHAQFGEYGVQSGDGTPTISSEEQRRLTIQYINEFMKG